MYSVRQNTERRKEDRKDYQMEYKGSNDDDYSLGVEWIDPSSCLVESGRVGRVDNGRWFWYGSCLSSLSGGCLVFVVVVRVVPVFLRAGPRGRWSWRSSSPASSRLIFLLGRSSLSAVWNDRHEPNPPINH